MSVVRNPEKKIWSRLVWTNPIPVNFKGLKEGVFQVGGEECVCGEEEDGSERAEGKG